jgi:hypothetical protein
MTATRNHNTLRIVVVKHILALIYIATLIQLLLYNHLGRLVLRQPNLRIVIVIIIGIVGIIIGSIVIVN